MQLILPPYPTYVNEQEVYIEHKGQRLHWTTSPFSKTNFVDDRAIFKHINEFWGSRPSEEQDQIFGIYQKIANIFDSTDLNEKIDQLLSEQLEDLMAHLKFQDVRFWTVFHSDIIFPGPPVLAVKYEESTEQLDKNHTREKTYTVDNYIDLVCMIIQLRAMIPIWGRYIARTNKIAGTMFKEFYAFKLLDHTDFVREPAVQKLYGYIKNVLPASGNKADILQGISSEEFPLWNMCILIVRKLCLSDIRGLDPSAILIRHISRHIMEKAIRIDTDADMALRNKNDRDKGDSKGQSEENQISLIEQYKIKEEVSRGDIQFYLWHIRDPFEIAKIIAPNVTKELVDQAMKALPSLIKTPADPAQTMLLMWLIDPVVPAETVSFMNNIERCRCLCACAAAYWAKGHYLISALCTATPAPNEGDVILSGTDSKGRLSKETAERLEQLFPYGRKTRSNKVVRDEIKAIDEMIRVFTNQSWYLNVSDEQMQIIHPRYPQIRRLAIPHNFKEQIALLVIDIATRESVKTLTSEEPSYL